MAEIIYSVLLSNEGPISMDVTTDPIECFESGYFSVGKTKSGKYFHSAQGFIREYTTIKSLMVLSIWRPKPNIISHTDCSAIIKDSVTSSDQSMPLEEVMDSDIYEPGDYVRYKWIADEIRMGTVIRIGLSIIIEDHVTGNIRAVIPKNVVGCLEIRANPDDRMTTEIPASFDDRMITEICASPDDRMTTNC